ncbi:MAG: T9SS type A sorting domain-containing protein [Siphonobacter sp.]
MIQLYTKTLFVFLLGLLAFYTNGQNYTLVITTKIDGQIKQTAVDFIYASNEITVNSSVEYTAGKAVVLEPGFVTTSGTAFEARIKTVSVESEESNLVVNVYPNPVQKVLTIEYELPADAETSLTIYDLQGRLIKQLQTPETRKAGFYKATWDTSELSGGVYLYSLKTEKETKSGRIAKQ